MEFELTPLRKGGGNQQTHHNNLFNEAVEAVEAEKQWTSTLLMAVSPYVNGVSGGPYEERDIFQLSSDPHFKNMPDLQYRFDPSVYPPGSSQKLFDDLNSKAKTNGFYFIKFSKDSSKGTEFHTSYKYTCYRGKKYSPKKETRLRDITELRNNSIRNDKKRNSRGEDGKSMGRKTNSTKALSASETCKCKVTVYEDSNGFFTKAGSVEGQHRCHVQQNMMSSLLKIKECELEAEHKTFLEQQRFIGASAEDISTSFGEVFGLCFTPGQVRNYLRLKNLYSPTNSNETEGDRLLRHFRESKTSHVALYETEHGVVSKIDGIVDPNLSKAANELKAQVEKYSIGLRSADIIHEAS